MSQRSPARDFLTGAFARPYFLNLLKDECRFAMDIGKPFCVCLIDVDQLRKINEDAGMRAGDALLAKAAEAVRTTLDLPQWANLRAVLGRYDGDSLILLMPGCLLQRAEQLAYVLKRRIAEQDYDGNSITASVALAAFKRDDDVDGLLARVEKTMCLAKQFGGDAIEVSRTAELSPELASVTRLPVSWQGGSKKSA